MACYSNKLKGCCAKMVFCISFLIFILGLVTAIFGAMQMGVVQPPNKFIGGKDGVDQSGFGMGVLVIGLICLLIALLGCATCKYKKVFFAIPFIILTALLGLIILIIGMLIINVVGPITDDLMKQACDTPDAADLGNTYNNAISKYICSELCPCPKGDGDSYKTYWEGLGSNELNKFGREKDIASMNTADVELYNAAETVVDKVQVLMTPLVFGTGTTYDSWQTCYEGVIKGKIAADPNPSQAGDSLAQVDKFIKDGGLDFVKEVEVQMDCASACKIPLFYATRSIADERPTQDCANALMDKLTGAVKPAGLISVLTGVVLLIAMFGACPLCTGFDEEEGDK